MTLTELYALSAFIDQLASDDDYEHNAESARLDAIFVKECHDAGRNPIEVSRAAEAYWERRWAMRANDFAYRTAPRTAMTYGICKGPRNWYGSKA